MERCYILILLTLIQFGCTKPDIQSPLNIGPEIILRGPYTTDLDSQISITQLGSGFAVFTGNGNARRSVANSILGAAAVQGPVVLDYGSGINYWLNHVGHTDTGLWGFVHQEDHMDYANNNQTYKSMGVTFSSDEGLHWTTPQTVLTAGFPVIGQSVGIGDCSVLDSDSDEISAYCLWADAWKTVVVRGNKNNLLHWTPIHVMDFKGSTVATLGTSTILLYAYQNSVYWSQSHDGINFGIATELTKTDAEIVAPVLVNAMTGSNQLSGTSYLFYTKMIDGQRYLAYKTVDLSITD